MSPHRRCTKADFNSIDLHMESEASEDEFGIVETSDGKEDEDANFLERSAASPIGEGPEGNGMDYRVQEDQDDGPEPRGTARDTIADAWSLSDDSSAAPEDEANGAHARLPEPHPHPAAAIQFLSERAGRHGTTATFASEADEWAKAAFQRQGARSWPASPQNATQRCFVRSEKSQPRPHVGIIGNERAKGGSIKARSVHAEEIARWRMSEIWVSIWIRTFHRGHAPRSSARA